MVTVEMNAVFMMSHVSFFDQVNKVVDYIETDGKPSGLKSAAFKKHLMPLSLCWSQTS